MHGDVHLPLLGVRCLGQHGKCGLASRKLFNDLPLVPRIRGFLRAAVEFSHVLDGRREKLAELILGISAKLHRRAQSMAQLRRHVLKIVSEKSGGRPYVVFLQMVVDLCPHVPLIPLSWPVVDTPTPELHRGPSPDKPLGPHVAQPDRIMRGHDELRVWELPLQKGTHLATVTRVHRHENVVEDRKGERGALEVPH